MKEDQRSLKSKQWQFVDMRANGSSYSEISKVLNVSKPTLIAWAKELKHDLANARTVVRDEVLSRIAANTGTRMEMLLGLQMKILSELSARNLSSVAPEKLLTMHESISKELDAAITRQTFTGEGAFVSLDPPPEVWSA